MREMQGDIWVNDIPVKVITTNGDIDMNGNAVMGAGIALQAANMMPEIKVRLAEMIKANGNVTHLLGDMTFGRSTWSMIALPVKYHWRERADMSLIENSIRELVEICDNLRYDEIALPRPGCGVGGLHWGLVKPLLQGWLDDRFVIVDKKL